MCINKDAKFILLFFPHPKHFFFLQPKEHPCVSVYGVGKLNDERCSGPLIGKAMVCEAVSTSNP
jgi:hypothetical protein